MEGEMLPPPSFGSVITILSIDGGGVRGIIPAILLMHLEAELQRCKQDENVRIADFFDVVAGTSTGGLIAAMLTAPDQNGRPLFSAAEIKDFYRQESPNIFHECEWRNILSSVINPKYDGKYLHETIRKQLKETKLSQTLTNVVIPTFDMKQVRPNIFSSFKLTENSSVDAKLSDICIGTSAAPTYFPPYSFHSKANNGVDKEFNLIDGGIIANNPALLAIGEVMQQHKKGNPDFSRYKTNDYTQIVLVSLGTGFRKPNDEFDARKAAHWGTIFWAAPSMEFALDGSQDLVDYHLASVFQALPHHHHKNYLRIQTDELSGEMAEMDCASERNLDNLEDLAKRLLNRTVTRMNLDTFNLEPILLGAPTNAQALTRVAEFLTGERHERLAKFKSTK